MAILQNHLGKVTHEKNETGFGHPPLTMSVSAGISKMLYRLGVRHGFGVIGGGIAPFVDALGESQIQVTHFRHECGAAFAATEASLVSERPTVVFTTFGPGLCNALNGIIAARVEGAKVILISGWQGPKRRGQFAFQETSWEGLPISDLFSGKNLFDYAKTIEYADEIKNVAVRLAGGVARPGGFVAHIGVSPTLQTQQSDTAELWHHMARAEVSAPACPKLELERCVDILTEESVCILAGFGARAASSRVRYLAELCHAPVMTTPRGNGVFPAGHPLFLGSTGLGGHDSLTGYLAQNKPQHLLVLGTKMGEFTTHWNPLFVPTDTLIHVDVDTEVFGRAFPEARTTGICADIGTFLSELIPLVEKRQVDSGVSGSFQCITGVTQTHARISDNGKIHPALLLSCIQKRIVEGSDAIVLADVGNTFCWANHVLAFKEPYRYRTSMSWGSVGHASAGVIGAALGSGKRAIAIAGDGAMLMNNEISTAVQYKIPAVWIVLNDRQYGMIYHGMSAQGFNPAETLIPDVDFSQFARSLGASAIRVEHPQEIDDALIRALQTEVPLVVDVRIDPSVPPPFMARIDALVAQGAKK